ETRGIEARRCERNRNAHALGDAVLPVELAAVIVVAASLDALETRSPFAHLRQSVGKDFDVVVHHPDPLAAEFVRGAHALAEPTGPAGVGLQLAVYDLGADPFAERFDDLSRVVSGIVVDDDDTARLRIHRGDAAQKS